MSEPDRGAGRCLAAACPARMMVPTVTTTPPPTHVSRRPFFSSRKCATPFRPPLPPNSSPPPLLSLTAPSRFASPPLGRAAPARRPHRQQCPCPPPPPPLSRSLSHGACHARSEFMTPLLLVLPLVSLHYSPSQGPSDVRAWRGAPAPARRAAPTRRQPSAHTPCTQIALHTPCPDCRLPTPSFLRARLPVLARAASGHSVIAAPPPPPPLGHRYALVPAVRPHISCLLAPIRPHRTHRAPVAAPPCFSGITNPVRSAPLCPARTWTVFFSASPVASASPSHVSPL